MQQVYYDPFIPSAQDCAGVLSGSNRSEGGVDYVVLRRGDRVFVEMRPREPR